MIPPNAQFVTVEFAKRDGTIHKQRVTTSGLYLQPGNVIARIIAAATKGCKRRKIEVCNVQRITHGTAVLFHYLDTGARFR